MVSLLLVSHDELNEFILILSKLITRIFESKGLVLFLDVNVFDFLLDGVVRELYKKHFFLLVDELTNVLGTLLSGKLHSRFSNLHCSTDIASLCRAKVVHIFIAGDGFDVAILDSL
jgi:hypothetical protein